MRRLIKIAVAKNEDGMEEEVIRPSSFDRFRLKNAKYDPQAQKEINTRFIFDGYPSTQIMSAVNDDETGEPERTITAAVYNKQMSDEAFIYTELDQPLSIGSIWLTKGGLALMVMSEIITIKDVNWHKYYCFICNVVYDDIYGLFIGPEKKAITNSLVKDTFVVSQQKPVLVMPQADPLLLDVKDKIYIKKRAWKVEEYDCLSVEGIVYYTLSASSIGKDIMAENEGKDCFIEKYEQPTMTESDIPFGSVIPGTRITLDTVDGYFNTSCPLSNVKILARSLNKITFEIPFNMAPSESLTVYTKKKEENGVITQVTTDYVIMA